MQTASSQPAKRDTRFKQNVDDEPHGSGTIVHRRVRDPDDPYNQIGITCHGCGQERFAHKQSIRNPSWKGLCSDCLSSYSVPRKWIGDERVDSGAVIHHDEPDPNDPGRKMVSCKNFSVCGNKEMMRVDSGNKNKQPFFCKKCRKEDRKTRIERAWELASRAEGGAQNKGPRGRKLGDQVLNRQRARADFENIVNKLNETLTEREITRRAIAAEFHERGEMIDESTVTTRVQLLFGKGTSVAAAVAQVIRNSV